MAAFPDTTPLPELPRSIIEATIERLITMLDDMDPDPDLEPSLGAPEVSIEPPYCGSSVKLAILKNQRADIFADDVRQFRSADTRQEDWADGGSDERELECEDEGGQCDDEGDWSSDSDLEERGFPDAPVYPPRLFGKAALQGQRPKRPRASDRRTVPLQHVCVS